jgi:hypothetical protein
VETYRELVAYCLQDKRALKDVDARLPPLSAPNV